MSDVAIRVDNLSKHYRIGGRQERYKTLRDTLTDTFISLFRRVGKQRQGQANGTVSLNETIWALKNVSFEVKHGEVLGIIGRNGAGKSTLLKILSRITEPTEGCAGIYGRIGSLLEVGTGFHAELTGRENVYLNGAILGMKKIEINRKFDEIVAFAEVEKFIDTPVKHYSSGMYMRLAFAVAAHLEPEILLVDEVLAVGDLQFQKKCLNKMQDISEAGRTILFVSHNMSAITRLCSRAVLLNQGQLITNGTAAAVVSEYLTTALGASGTAEWTDIISSPGTNGVKLMSVSVTNIKDTPLNVINITEAIKLKIGYYVSIPHLKFRCAAGFYTQGTCAFTTLEAVEATYEHEGLYYSSVVIPGNFLSEGDYSISITLFASRGKKLRYCKVNDVVVFQVYDPITGHSARGDYSEGLAGVTRPLLEWQLDYAGASQSS